MPPGKPPWIAAIAIGRDLLVDSWRNEVSMVRNDFRLRIGARRSWSVQSVRRSTWWCWRSSWRLASASPWSGQCRGARRETARIDGFPPAPPASSNGFAWSRIGPCPGRWPEPARTDRASARLSRGQRGSPSPVIPSARAGSRGCPPARRSFNRSAVNHRATAARPPSPRPSIIPTIPPGARNATPA